MFPNFDYFVQHIDYFEYVMQNNLISSGLLNYINSNKIKCQDFFTSSFEKYVSLCNNN